MANTLKLMFCDGFAHYTSGFIPAKWTQQASCSISSAAARNGTQGMIVGNVAKTLALKSKIITGFAYRVNFGSGSVAFGGNVYQISAVNTSRSLSILFRLGLENDGTLSLWAGSTLIANPKTFVMVNSSWAYIECKVTFTASTNVVVAADLRVNGAAITSGSATSNTPVSSLLSGTAQGNFHQFAAGNAAVGDTYMADLYIGDNETDGGDNYYGDVTIIAIYPRADVHVDWASTAASAFAAIKEHPPDADTSYISSNTTGQYTTCYFDNVSSFAGTILAAQFSLYMRKDAEGSRAVRHVVGADVSESADEYLNDNYFFHHIPYDVDPVSGLAWTPAIINAQQFGVKLTV